MSFVSTLYFILRYFVSEFHTYSKDANILCYYKHVIPILSIYKIIAFFQLLGKGSNQFRLDPSTGRVYLADNGKNLDHEEEEKLYLRLRATDDVGHITESQV